MTNSTDIWATGVKSYIQYFSEPRPAPAEDNAITNTLKPHNPYVDAARTQTISRFDPAAIQHTLNGVTLHIAFVQKVLRDTGPVITPANFSLWQFASPPSTVPDEVLHEADYYEWFDWVVCHPAASAVNAVRDQFYEAAGVPIPVGRHSRTTKVNKTTGGGATDIIHHWTAHGPKCTPHEFKRDIVLRVVDRSVLDFLVEQAGLISGYKFRTSAQLSTLEGKGYSIISQTINEMVSTETGHAIICTQHKYVMLRLTPALQLEISPVYATRESPNQASDMANVVLFYTLAALGAGTRYAVGPATGITAMRVTLPAFPTSIFQPQEGLFRGGILGRTELISKSRPFFPCHGSNDVTIAYGRLIFLFVASRSLVAKTAHGPSATQRLVHEYDAYAAMRTLQGAAIPNVIGMFTTKDQKNTVLIMSYAGKALSAFSELQPRDKLTLFHRLIRLHKSGVQHNDLEPRNVTLSSSGPLIIDFDHASLDHHCPGASCQELQQVAQALDLDPAATETLAEDTAKPPSVYSIVVAFISVVVSALLGFPRRPRSI
ncbi:hypothetical protein B0H10DRAFT_2068840 [Mycena sp. CBHHK59/15]|nr:hypothetical protein B0H10DRAFT_2068840 [Mycena sp. CBHHK59/15]